FLANVFILHCFLAIAACAEENIRRGYSNVDISVFSDSRAALMALQSHRIKSQTVKYCHDILCKLAERNSVTLIWVPGHEGYQGNEKADLLAKLAAPQTPIGPEPFAAVPVTVVKRELESWVQKEHRKKWSCTPALRQSKLFIRWPDKKTITELIGLSRNSVRRIVALRTGHNLLRRHAKLMGIVRGND